jgi:hypothetical protein
VCQTQHLGISYNLIKLPGQPPRALLKLGEIIILNHALSAPAMTPINDDSEKAIEAAAVQGFILPFKPESMLRSSSRNTAMLTDGSPSSTLTSSGSMRRKYECCTETLFVIIQKAERKVSCFRRCHDWYR